MPIFFLLVVTLFSVVVTYWVVERREGDVRFWVLLACLMGPLMLPFVFFAKPKDQHYS